MNLITSKKSWLTAPVAALVSLFVFIIIWAALDPETLVPLFDNHGASPVELMTLPLFALIVPLVWLCPPCGGDTKRKCFWAALWSLLAVMAIVRETDLHKMLFAQIWPEIVETFPGTVFKMRFIKAASIPFVPKLFVITFFVFFFVAVIVPLVRYIVPLFKGFLKREPVAWTMATFGATSVVVMIVDRLPANLRHAGVELSERTLALLTVFEEGGEMTMALLALLAVLQSYLIFGLPRKEADVA